MIKPSEEGEIVVVAFFPTPEQAAERDAVAEHNKNRKKGPIRMWNNRPKRFLARKLPDGRLRELVSGEILDFDPEMCKIEV